jgi:hypothetical protein
MNVTSSTTSAPVMFRSIGLLHRPPCFIRNGWLLARNGANTAQTTRMPIHTALNRARRFANVSDMTCAAKLR